VLCALAVLTVHASAQPGDRSSVRPFPPTNRDREQR